MLEPESLPTIPEDEIFNFLKSKREWIDGVCITGGEPLLQQDLIEFARKIKSLGFRVKLDTNGSLPERLEKAINSGVIDYIAMDVKAPPE
ncbi:MAG TPA: radical SAM protein, partial [Candidatus Woesearchaeota archaeon]|nr:radical SAM protein [Candidatus Woesearchaeota archaeon]